MFTAETLHFLRALSANNSRDWFAAQGPRYERDVKAAAKAFAAEIEAGLAARTGRDHRARLFRIHRELRFSKDKTPYNTHIHVSFAPVDPAGLGPVWMVGLAPAYFSVGCGVFGFDRAALDAYRARVGGPEGDAVATLLGDLAGSGVRIDPPELKRVPTPWPRDHPRGALLRRKGLTAWIDAQRPEDGLGPEGVARTLAATERLRPVFDLLERIES